MVRAILAYCIRVYGACRVILSDPGCEFHNALVRLLAERFNIRMDGTAAQPARSNGACERHNGVNFLSTWWPPWLMTTRRPPSKSC